MPGNVFANLSPTRRRAVYKTVRDTGGFGGELLGRHVEFRRGDQEIRWRARFHRTWGEGTGNTVLDALDAAGVWFGKKENEG